MKKRALSILLILLTLLNAIPFISAAADTVSYSGSNFSTNATIASILDEIFAEYVPGKHYFVSDGGDNLNGNKNLPCTSYGNGCGYFSKSWQCLAYVRWAQNKLFGFDEWRYDLFYELSGYSNATEYNCRTWFQTNKNKLHPGAHIRFANHSILYLSQDSNGVTFLHCNWGKTCMVKFATLSWADFASLFGKINYIAGRIAVAIVRKEAVAVHIVDGAFARRFNGVIFKTSLGFQQSSFAYSRIKTVQTIFQIFNIHYQKPFIYQLSMT